MIHAKQASDLQRNLVVKQVIVHACIVIRHPSFQEILAKPLRLVLSQLV